MKFLDLLKISNQLIIYKMNGDCQLIIYWLTNKDQLLLYRLIDINQLLTVQGKGEFLKINIRHLTVKSLMMILNIII